MACATTSSYDAANELTNSKSNAGVTTSITTYTSDAAGNLLTSLSPSNQRTTNTWDFENRLTQVALPSAIVDTFTYNGDGQRVQKIDSTGTTKHVWDGQNILLETDASNIIQVVYTLAAGALWQFDLAVAKRDRVVLPVRWARIDDAARE